MSATLIARKREVELCKNILAEKKAQFIALYGRHRVGKTFLVLELFSEGTEFFELTGVKDGGMKTQLEVFKSQFTRQMLEGFPIATPKNWMEALELLTIKIEKMKNKKKIVIFFDELPWLATKRSGLLQAIDHYWNTRWSRFSNLVFIACGSAASWMLDNLVNAKGGLHNRITRSILLKPFTLKETKLFLESQNIKLSNKHILDIYMVTGGVPFYLESIRKTLSVTQNINDMCFKEGGLLKDEFLRLFSSLFSQAETNEKIIRAIALHQGGISRDNLIKSIGTTSGGNLKNRLTELEAAGFIKSYKPYGKKRRDTFYRVIDEYSLFYLRWIEPFQQSGHEFTQSHWHDINNTSAWKSWAGYSFENVCLKHTDEIRKALGLENVGCVLGSWRYLPAKGKQESGAQIDLLFDRDDEAITLCEIKYSNNKFAVDKTLAKNLMNKEDVFKTITKTQKQIFIAIITSCGMKRSLWSDEIINNAISLQDIIDD